MHYLSDKSVVFFRGKWLNASLRNWRLKTINNIILIDTSHEWYVGKTWYDDQQYILATQAKQVFYLQDPTQNNNYNNWRVVEEVHHQKLWNHPSIGVVNEIDVVNNTQSTDFTFVVDLGTLPVQTTLGEVGESSVVARRNVAPTINEDDFINDDSVDGDTYFTDEEINTKDNDNDEDVVHVYCSTDESDWR